MGEQELCGLLSVGRPVPGAHLGRALQLQGMAATDTAVPARSTASIVGLSVGGALVLAATGFGLWALLEYRKGRKT